MGFRTAPMSQGLFVAAPTAVDRDALFTPEIRAQIDAWCAKYPAEWRQSATIPALHILQDANGGWLAQQQLDDLALYLGCSTSQVDSLRKEPAFLTHVKETRSSGKVSFDRNEIDQWMEAGKINPASPF